MGASSHGCRGEGERERREQLSQVCSSLMRLCSHCCPPSIVPILRESSNYSPLPIRDTYLPLTLPTLFPSMDRCTCISDICTYTSPLSRSHLVTSLVGWRRPDESEKKKKTSPLYRSHLVTSLVGWRRPDESDRRGEPSRDGPLGSDCHVAIVSTEAYGYDHTSSQGGDQLRCAEVL